MTDDKQAVAVCFLRRHTGFRGRQTYHSLTFTQQRVLRDYLKAKEPELFVEPTSRGLTYIRFPVSWWQDSEIPSSIDLSGLLRRFSEKLDGVDGFKLEHLKGWLKKRIRGDILHVFGDVYLIPPD